MNTRASIPETRRPWFRHYSRESATPPLQESTTYSPEAAEIGRLGTGDCGSWARSQSAKELPGPEGARWGDPPRPRQVAEGGGDGGRNPQQSDHRNTAGRSHFSAAVEHLSS